MSREVPSVESDDWVSQRDAAAVLRVSMARIGLLVGSGALMPVHGPDGRAGVSRSSVDELSSTRSDAGVLRRVGAYLGDITRGLARGV